MGGGYEVLEHTADVGIRAWGDSLEGAFDQATRGLLDITGAFDEAGDGETLDISIDGDDLGGLLVEWLEEVLYTQDAKDRVVTAIDVDRVGEGGIRGSIRTKPRPGTLEGTAVKAITYHQLLVEERADGNWIAQVFFDI